MFGSMFGRRPKADPVDKILETEIAIDPFDAELVAMLIELTNNGKLVWNINEFLPYEVNINELNIRLAANRLIIDNEDNYYQILQGIDGLIESINNKTKESLTNSAGRFKDSILKQLKKI
jgi:hypothetical protein